MADVNDLCARGLKVATSKLCLLLIEVTSRKYSITAPARPVMTSLPFFLL